MKILRAISSSRSALDRRRRRLQLGREPAPSAAASGRIHDRQRGVLSNVAVQGRAYAIVRRAEGRPRHADDHQRGPPSNVVRPRPRHSRIDGTAATSTRSSAPRPDSAAQISMNVDKGTYCLSVYDLGTLQNFVSFSVAIFHP